MIPERRGVRRNPISSRVEARRLSQRPEIGPRVVPHSMVEDDDRAEEDWREEVDEVGAGGKYLLRQEQYALVEASHPM